MNSLTKQIYKIYTSWRKLVIWVLCFLFTILSIKVYINNFLWIQKSLYDTDIEVIKTKQKISYYKTYKMPYLESEYAIKFLKHQNWLPDAEDELIIKLQKNDQEFNQQWFVSEKEDFSTKQTNKAFVIEDRSSFWAYKFKKWIWAISK